jgi:outer membrane protein TolC
MRWIVIVLILALIAAVSASAAPLQLDQTLDRLLNETTRGRIIAGQYEVSQAKFNAEKTGYYLPEISLNATLPTYRSTQDYNTYFGFPDPLLFKRTNVSGVGNLRMKQKIITGGDLTVETRFDMRNDQYPSPVYGTGQRDIIGFATATDKRRLGDLYIQFSQPLLQSSETRSAYLSARDNLTKAEIQWRIDRTELTKEGITAFLDLLAAGVDRRIADNQSQLAAYTAGWDSVKYADSVINEEAWLTSKSGRLEKQLAMFDAQATYEERLNEFVHLLDLPLDTALALDIPPVPRPPDQTRAQQLLENAESSADPELLRTTMEMAERQLAKTRSSYGLNGTLNASYSIGRGTVVQSKPAEESEEKIDTKDWRVSLDVSYPIWDGGASGANVHSQELAYESARLGYLAAKRNARNKTAILLKRIEINFSKLSLLEEELQLAERKLRDAEQRFTDGMISQGTLLENRVFHLEAQKNKLNTMKSYLIDLTELEKSILP